ncbi:MAG: hypothetical protein GY856_51135, partial [bacterium]|nr:hypothetical protein [bacterium]
MRRPTSSPAPALPVLNSSPDRSPAAAGRMGRAGEGLRRGVRAAVTMLGAGFLRHCSNKELHKGLTAGELNAEEYYRQLLRLVYWLMFLFVAEDRGLLLDSLAPEEARERYRRFYATRGLRCAALSGRGDSHGYRWQGFKALLAKLDQGRPELALPAFGDFLWSQAGILWLLQSDVAGEDFHGAVRCLCTGTAGGRLHAVDWGLKSPGELGMVYENMLALHPRIDVGGSGFELCTVAGSERKRMGIYYTPPALVDRLLDSALDPVLSEAADRHDPEAAIQLVRGSGLYPLCGRGDVNTYALFSELNRHLVSPGGRVGCIVPAGIVTDHTTRYFFRDLMETGTLVSLYGFREIRR